MANPVEISERLREPNLFKFRLRQLFLVVTLVSILSALIATTQGPWPWMIGLFALLVAAHILGNLIGTRLRDTSEDVVRWRSADPRQTPNRPCMTPLGEMPTVPLLPETNLRNFGCIVAGMKWYLLGGFSLGFVLAGTLLRVTVGHRISWPGWFVGSISGGVMGVWIALLVVSFTTIARDALRQANDRDV